MDHEIARWSRRQRTRLLAERAAISYEERQSASRRVAARLHEWIAARHHQTIGLYWPIKHEINLLSWADDVARTHGVTLCLPVVVERHAPLEYWRWRQGDALGRGLWDIPVPARRDVMVPDLMLAPLVGFDAANYRLGYGGGYFDRTLAALTSRPMVVGIGYDLGGLDSIFPQPHDIPMDGVVTERRDTLPPKGNGHAV